MSGTNIAGASFWTLNGGGETVFRFLFYWPPYRCQKTPKWKSEKKISFWKKNFFRLWPWCQKWPFFAILPPFCGGEGARPKQIFFWKWPDTLPLHACQAASRSAQWLWRYKRKTSKIWPLFPPPWYKVVQFTRFKTDRDESLHEETYPPGPQIVRYTFSI